MWSLLFTGSLMGGVVQSTVEAFQGRRLICKDVGEGKGGEGKGNREKLMTVPTEPASGPKHS